MNEGPLWTSRLRHEPKGRSVGGLSPRRPDLQVGDADFTAVVRGGTSLALGARAVCHARSEHEVRKKMGRCLDL